MTKVNPKPDDTAQSKRFIETAREIETDERPEEFERVFTKLVSKKAAPKDS